MNYLGLVAKWVRNAEPIIDKERFEQARKSALEQERSGIRESMYHCIAYSVETAQVVTKLRDNLSSAREED